MYDIYNMELNITFLKVAKLVRINKKGLEIFQDFCIMDVKSLGYIIVH